MNPFRFQDNSVFFQVLKQSVLKKYNNIFL